MNTKLLIRIFVTVSTICCIAVTSALHAQSPGFVSYQGRVAVSGTNFTGTGGFKFAVVNSGASSTYWSSGANEVSVSVNQGIYSVLLGDSAITNMADFSTLNTNGNANIFLRVWFDDGVHGLQLLAPDQPIASVPYAFEAGFLTSDGTSGVQTGGGNINITSGTNIDITSGSTGVVSLASSTVGIVVRGSGASPGVFVSSGSAVFTGNGNFNGAISAASGNFNGVISAASGNFSGNGNFNGVVSAASGNFSGNVSAQSFNSTSDRTLKENFTPTDSREILKRVVGLPITSWNFKTESETRHIGPMAQDFYEAFKLGTDDRHIGMVDEGGVALAAIQGLNAELEEKDAKIKDLEKRLAEVEAKVERMTRKAAESGGK